MIRTSRRAVVQGFLGGAGALVLGFDPVHRSWITSAFAETSVIAIPDLDGVLLTDPATLATFADDYGHLVHHTPLAVLEPGSVEDVRRAVQFCRRHGIQVAARGQGHSTAGQSQVLGGLVIDMATLNKIEHIGPDCATVQAGLLWSDLVAATVPIALTPPVLTGFIGLSIGGTLSMGGIGAASFRSGAQVDHVLELEVVTGEGELKTCSPLEEPLLYNAVLGGVGQYGVIVRAKLPLIPVAPSARNYVIDYTDIGQFFADIKTLTTGTKIDGLYGQIGLNADGSWAYTINAVKFFEPSAPPDDTSILEGLNFSPLSLTATTLDTLSYDDLVDSLIALLQTLGLNDIPHVWGDVFLPASQVQSFVQDSLTGLTAADLGPAGFILLFPVRNAFRDELAFRLPSEGQVFLFDILSSGSATDSSYAATELAKCRQRFLQARSVGGTLYPIGSTPMTKSDWAIQYGGVYPLLALAKRLYDPADIMTPGPGIF
ncbi:MAG: FAD-binding protein [Polyangiaceae bacterium]|jgi:FAD/FMN-containing dehydrogenase